MLRKIAAIGANGKFHSNCERDLQRLILRSGSALDVKIEQVKIRLYNPKTEQESPQYVAMIFPDMMASALYLHSEKIFRKVFFGDKVDASTFWKHCQKNAPWMKNHPASKSTRLDRLIPMSLYGDEVQCFRNTEGGVVSVVAWCSDFSASLASLSRYFPICILPDHYATPNTFEDIWRALAPRISNMCDNQVDHVWSKDGYAFTYSSTQGDLKWLVEKFGLHNYHKNSFCSWCACVKSHADPSMTLGDFREGASHRSTRVSHEGFFAQLGKAPEDYHPVFQIPGCLLERFMHDVCHSQLLGTGKVCNGSVLTYLCEVGYFIAWPGGQYPVALSQCLREAYCQFNQWKSGMPFKVNQPRFTPSRLSRTQRASYPCLSSKAACSKALTFWLSKCAVENAARQESTSLDKHVANCIWTYAEVLRLLDEPWPEHAGTHFFIFFCYLLGK